MESDVFRQHDWERPAMTTAGRRAVIDVGTNSVKLLVADVAADGVRPVLEKSRQTRLGAGLYADGLLDADSIARTAAAVSAFATEARALGATEVRALGTSAAREARNSEALVAAVRAACGLSLEIVSGEAEAELAFAGVSSVPELESVPLLLVEVGGGSTQFLAGRGGNPQFKLSVPLGTVRLLETAPHDDPPAPGQLAGCRAWITGQLDRHVRPGLAAALAQLAQASPRTGPLVLVSTGGTATILARMAAETDEFDRDQIERTRMTLRWLTGQVERLWGATLGERRGFTGLPANRADVILYGAVVYEAVMRLLQLEEMRVSTRGLRFAVAAGRSASSSGGS